MVNGGGTPQDPIVERLIRLEIEMKAANERSEAHFEALTQRYDAQMAASNQRVTDVMNLLMESIRQTNERISETNQRIDTAAQDSKEEFARLHRRLDRVDSRIDKLFYVMIGVGAAVIATLVAGQIMG